MSKTAAEVQAKAPADEPKKEPEPFPAVASGSDEHGRRWEDVNILGTQYRFREISVPESDAAWDGAQNPNGTVNARLNQRLELVAGIEEPKITIDDIDTWSVRKLRAVIYVFDRINNLSAADMEGNA